jgi:hypothetical protein
MVVVDNAEAVSRPSIVVTSVLQTAAGKMIFGRHIEAGVLKAPARDGTREKSTPCASTALAAADLEKS